MSSPQPEALRRVELCVRIAVALQCIALWRITFLDGTSIGTTLFMTLRWEEANSLLVDHSLAWVVLAAGLSALWRPTKVAAVIVSSWFAMVALLTAVQGGSFGAAYAPVAHATRYGLPLLMFLTAMTGLDPEQRRAKIEFVARWVAALTFIAHGIEALLANPRFIDYVITAFRRIDIEVSESTTRILLRIIGVQDLALAAMLLLKRWRWVAGYMAFWGALTAGSRMVHMGLPKWPATLVRTANAAVPLVLWLLWAKAAPTQPGEERAAPAQTLPH